MSDRENIGAGLEQFNNDAGQFANDLVGVVLGQDHEELVAECTRAYLLAEELQAVLGDIAARSTAYHNALDSFSTGNDRQAELKNRASVLFEGSSLDLAVHVGYLNFGVVETRANASAGADEAQRASRTVGKIKGDLGKYTRGLKVWADTTKEGVTTQARHINEKVSEWLNRY